MFITFEGGEGVGKSTNISALADWLMAQDIEVVVTREPGGTVIAEMIREDLLKATHTEPMHDMTELLLVYAARVQHVEQVIKPALQQGRWVLCDRFNDSTIAYQGYGRGIDLDLLGQMKQLALGALEPDLTLLLQAPLSVGMARAQQRAAEQDQTVDRFEQQKLDFFERVAQGFQQLAKQHDRIVEIDASQPLDQVKQSVLSAVSATMKVAP